jgi:hypothetical protein
MPAFVRIDVAKDILAVALLGPKTSRKTSVPNTPAGYARLVQWLANQHVIDVRVCLEATPVHVGDERAAAHALIEDRECRVAPRVVLSGYCGKTA